MPHEVRGRFAQLRYGAGRRIETCDGHCLDRVDDQHHCASLGCKIEDSFDRSLRYELEASGVYGQPAGSLGHLAHGLLAGRIENAMFPCKGCGALQQ